MCVVSAVTDHYQRQWPVYQLPPAFQWNPAIFQPTLPVHFTITPEQWAEYQRLKQAAEEIDRKTGQPDCVKPGVDEWEEKVVQLVKPNN